MSEGMIIRRGGGASLKATDALLRVQAPAGSTVTITKGSVSKTDLGHENADDNSVYDYYFIIHASQFDSVNPWTVTATLGSNTATSTVIVDAADEYDLILSYHVPSGYQEVEYLQSDGSQHILLPNTVTTANARKIKLKWNQQTAVNYSAIFGGSNTANASGSGSLAAFINATQSQNGLYYSGAKAITVPWTTLNTEYVVEIELAAGNQTVIYNGTSMSGTQAGTPSPSANMALFACLYNGSVKTSERAKARVYYYECYDENGIALLRAYPCYRKSDSVAGMWDNVSQTFLTNQGSGSFTVGGDVN